MIQYAFPNWARCAASVPGRYHLLSGIPCQDHFQIKDGDGGWIFVALADGAGSSSHGGLASKLATEEAIVVLERLLRDTHWYSHGCYPKSTEWRDLAFQAMASIRRKLVSTGMELRLNEEDLHSTLIIACIHSEALLIAHIGDGRAAYCFQEKWEACMHPFRGRYSNETVFVTSDYWEIHPEALETRVVLSKIQAVALMTDGCEDAAFIWRLHAGEKEGIRDPNLPSHDFLEPLRHQLIAMHAGGMTAMDIQLNWEQFLQSGTPALASSVDDKTLILICR